MTDAPIINCHGDRLAPTTGQHGSNVSAQRVDELDQACLAFASQHVAAHNTLNAIDIGGGSGRQSVELARLGANVLLIDLSDSLAQVNEANRAVGRNAIRFLRQDVRTLQSDDWPRPLHLVYSQRMISFLPYGDCFSLFKSLTAICAPGAMFFVSCGGIDTEFGKTYVHRNKPIAQRFAPLQEDMQKKHDLFAPMCLYREDDLADLMITAGLRVEKCWRTDFGNPRVIASNAKIG